ncbi:MAG: MBOAT family protein [Gemmatimonadales bacterium]|nr:MAG: MBOAT family protein [Gemmatimonadales bacterium]
MLFNSYEFLFAFLPVALAGFFLLGSVSRVWAIRWIIVASLIFYALWRPLNVLIIGPSIFINYALARSLQHLGQEGKVRSSRVVLMLGIAFNVAFLGYFKYANFLAGAVNDAFGVGLVLERIILPLGISFITFQKIAFLIDVQARRVTTFTVQDYCLFVLFFPQLIAGPIVHYREMMPQFRLAPCKPDPEHLAVGLTLILFGLFKKVVLADGIAPLVSGIYDGAGAAGAVSLLPAWMAAIGFTLQIYFDFSGYTDMALGTARCMGIRFPPNFNSPLKASNIIDFWMRWHMTLTRFLTAYVYNPLALSLTRRRMASGRPGFVGRSATMGAFLSLLVFPTLVTMVVSGVWHGADYLFIAWGFVHGVYLTVNHGWRLVVRRLWPDRGLYDRIMRPAGVVLTFVCVAAAMVLFRSPTVQSAVVLLKGLFGGFGVALPAPLYDRLGRLPEWVQSAGPTEVLGAYYEFKPLFLWIVGLGAIVFACPNTLQLLAPYEPALGFRTGWRAPGLGGRELVWRPTLIWVIVMSIVAFVVALHLGGKSEFLYWQF